MEIVDTSTSTHFRLFTDDEPVKKPHLPTQVRVSAFSRPTILIFEANREMQDHYRQFLKKDFNLLMVEEARYGLKMLQSLPVTTSPTTVQLGASQLSWPKRGWWPRTGNTTGEGVGASMERKWGSAREQGPVEFPVFFSIQCLPRPSMG